MFILTQFSPLGLWWTLSVQYILKDVQTIFFFFFTAAVLRVANPRLVSSFGRAPVC